MTPDAAEQARVAPGEPQGQPSEAAPKEAPKVALWRAVRVLLPLLLLVPSVMFLGYKVYASWGVIRSTQWRMNLSPLGLAALALLGSFLLNALLWHLVMRRHGGEPRFLQNLRIFCLTTVARRLPGGIWQIGGRMVLYHQEGTHGLVALKSSIWEIIVQALSALAVFALFVPWYGTAVPAAANYVWLLLLAIAPFVVMPSLLDRVFALLGRKLGWRDKWASRIAFRDIVAWFSMYLVSWANGGLILYWMVEAFYGDLQVGLLPAFCGFVALSGLVGLCLSFVPGGLGLREVTLSVLLAAYLPDPVAVGAAILFRLLLWLGETVYALIVLLIIRWRGMGALPGQAGA